MWKALTYECETFTHSYETKRIYESLIRMSKKLWECNCVHSPLFPPLLSLHVWKKRLERLKKLFRKNVAEKTFEKLKQYFRGKKSVSYECVWMCFTYVFSIIDWDRSQWRGRWGLNTCYTQTHTMIIKLGNNSLVFGPRSGGSLCCEWASGR